MAESGEVWVYPPPLQPGARLGVVAPAGPLRNPAAFEAGIAFWQGQGYELVLGHHHRACTGYLAGDDPQRRQDLLAALKDPQCRGILCARGGYGTLRLLEDWQWPQGEAKWLVGFSDITGLLWSYGQQRRVVGLHGPLVTTIATEPPWSQARLLNCLQGFPLPPLQGEPWQGGQATGPLLPANLTVATHLLGTAHLPPVAGAILAIEDVTEAPYRLDRLLTQWRLTGYLGQVAGVAVGRFSRCEDPAGGRLALEVVRERLGDLGIPVVGGLPFGHDGENAALPVGARATLDGDRGTLAIDPP